MKALCLNKLCSKFEVDMKKIEVPVRLYLGRHTTNSHRVPSKLHFNLVDAFFCHKCLNFSVDITPITKRPPNMEF